MVYMGNSTMFSNSVVSPLRLTLNEMGWLNMQESSILRGTENFR